MPYKENRPSAEDLNIKWGMDAVSEIKEDMEKFSKNWKAISVVPDTVARAALLLAQDEDTLRRFRIGWPECFSTEPNKVSVVTRSAIFALAESFVKREYEGNYETPEEFADLVKWYQVFGWWDVIQCECKADVPRLVTYGYENDPFPAEIQDQLLGRSVKAGDLLHYQGGLAMIAKLGHCEYHGEIIDTDALGHIGEFVLIAADTVDVEA